MPNESAAEFADEQFARVHTSVPRLPPSTTPKPDILTRVSVATLAGATVGYLVPPEVMQVSRSGGLDEQAAIWGAFASFFVAMINGKRLCESNDGNQSWFDYGKAGAAGAGFGAMWAGLTPAALFSLIDGGIIAGSTVGALYLYRRYKKGKQKKPCPHCDHKGGDCSQRICRVCYRMFFPAESKIDCSRRDLLTWFEVASYFDGHSLNYLDAVELTKASIKEWAPEQGPDGQVKINCEKFMKWNNEHKDVRGSFRGRGIESQSKEEVRDLLWRIDSQKK